ncbi:nucleotide disphospho-sugar-binding domain-containing protein [Micromonospora sp. PTRAS2]
MRVLFTTSAWPTHYFAVVPLAWAARSAGHEVRVACQPSMVPVVQSSGMAAVPMGPDVDFLAIRRGTIAAELAQGGPPAEGPNLSSGKMTPVFDAFQAATLSNVDDVIAFAGQWRPDLIVSDTMSPAGLVAARTFGVPGVRHLWAPDILGSTLGARIMSVLPGFYEPYEQRGLHIDGDPATLTVDPCPPSMQPPPVNRRQLRWVPYNGIGIAPSWLFEPRRKRRVLVTWGTSTTGTADTAAMLLPRILTALGRLDVEVVAAVTEAERHLVESRENVRMVQGAPLHRFMDTCDLVVHQGGASTMLTAGYHGVPQVAFPYLPEQVKDAGALVGTGVATQVPAEKADQERVDEAVGSVLGAERFRTAALALRDEIHAQPAPAEVIADLAALAQSVGVTRR